MSLALAKKLNDIVKLLRDAGATESSPETASATIADDIDTSWKRIAAWIKKNAKSWKPLKKGAGDVQIQKAETELGLRLPDEWKGFYKRP